MSPASSRITRAYTIQRYGRFWEVLDPTGDLVCVTVYKRGAKEVVHRLSVADRDLLDNIRSGQPRPERTRS